MRNHFVAVMVVIGAAGLTAAHAADVPSRRSFVSGNYSPFGVRTEPLVIYDDQPGVIVRSYWYAPWRNRHYFPSTGRRPKVGRLERITARPASKAEDYFRYWSISSVFAPELLPEYAPRLVAPPPAKPATPLPPMKQP
jgi:hypothetical protein